MYICSYIYSRLIIPRNYFAWELSMHTFLSAGFQKCMPLGGTAALAAWRWRQESWAAGDSSCCRCCCCEQKVQPCPQPFSDTHRWGFENKHTWDKMYTYKYTYTHIYIYGLRNLTSPGTVGRSWQRFASQGPESWANVTLTRVFSLLSWEPSLVRGPSAGPGKGRWSQWEYRNYPVWGGFFSSSSVSSGASAQFERSLIRLSHGILSEVFSEWEG